jgi:Putative zinc-finger/HEAT repeats
LPVSRNAKASGGFKRFGLTGRKERRIMDCKKFEENISLYLYGELSPDSRSAIEQHQDQCPSCRKRLESARELHDRLNQQPGQDPSPELLAQCRRELEEAIDRELQKVTWRGLLRDFFAGFAAVPATRAASLLTLLALGFGLGWTLRPLARTGQSFLPASAPALNAADLGNFHINGISQVQPDLATGGVKITVDAERRVTLEGSLDNPRIRGVLIDAVKSYHNPGIRHDTLDALRGAADDPTVRSALLYALKHDPNTGLRLDALQSLRDAAWCPEIEQGVIEVLRQDRNPGVRVEAADVLTRHATPAILPVLDRLASNDPNPYVRLKCIEAVQRLGRNED